MLRSSAGNFYNYFRPGPGELIRSAEPKRRFLSPRRTLLSLSLSFPLSSRPPPYSSPFFLFLHLHHHLAFLTTHGPSSSTVHFFSSLFSSGFFSPLPIPVPRSRPPRISVSPSRAIVPRAQRRSREPVHRERSTVYQNIWVVYLPRSSPSSDTTVIIVRHLLEVGALTRDCESPHRSETLRSERK